MASASQSENSPLLVQKLSAPSAHRRQNGSSASSHPEDHDDVETQSTFSHVSLDKELTYGRFYASHILSLLPGLALQLATIMLAFHAPCHIHDNPEDQASDKKMCRRLLSDWMSMTAFTFGLITWLAAYSFRPAIDRVVGWGTWMLQTGRQEIGEYNDVDQARSSSSSTLSTLIFILLRTSVLESLRMFSLMVINAVLFAGLAHLQDQGKIGGGSPLPRQHWLLDIYDPRFAMSLWVAIGWCTTEFVVSSFQMIDRLSLYKSTFEEVIPDEEISHLPPVSSYADSSQVNFDYTSDSAATVRGNSNGAGINKVDLQQDNKLNTLSPRINILRAKGRAEGATQEAESGFSLFQTYNEADEQEMARLRERLDEEMDNLLKARMRDELQQTLGQPLTEVPIVLCALWRIDGWLYNLGATLLMSASVALAQGPFDQDRIPRIFAPFKQVKTTLLILIALHTLLTSVWTLALPKLGFASVTYSSMLAGLFLSLVACFRWNLVM